MKFSIVLQILFYTLNPNFCGFILWFVNPYITICLLKCFDRHPFSMFISMKFIFFDCGTFHNLDSADWFSLEVTAVRYLLLTSGKPSNQFSSRKPHIARSTFQFLVTNLVISLYLLNTNDNSFILNTLLLIYGQPLTWFPRKPVTESFLLVPSLLDQWMAECPVL